MDVSCSTFCFTKEPFEHALRHIAELEFSKVDLGVSDEGTHLTPNDVLNDAAGVQHRIRQGPTIGFSGIALRTAKTGDEFLQVLDATAHLAKQIFAPIVTFEAGPSGSSMIDQKNWLTQCVRTVSIHGVQPVIRTKVGTVAEMPTFAMQLCEQVEGLNLALDATHFHWGPNQGESYEHVYPFVRHVFLCDSGKKADLRQVKVGRGEIEYGKIVSSLEQRGYNGALVVAIEDSIPSDMDTEAEVRKLRLLLESLL